MLEKEYITGEQIQQATALIRKELREGGLTVEVAKELNNTLRTDCKVAKLRTEIHRMLGEKPNAKTVRFLD